MCLFCWILCDWVWRNFFFRELQSALRISVYVHQLCIWLKFHRNMSAWMIDGITNVDYANNFWVTRSHWKFCQHSQHYTNILCKQLNESFRLSKGKDIGCAVLLSDSWRVIYAWEVFALLIWWRNTFDNVNWLWIAKVLRISNIVKLIIS